MKRFIKNILFFSFPAVLFFLPAFYLLWQTGEFHSLAYIGARARSSEPIMVGNAYSNFQTQYQLEETKIRKPDVFIVWNSSVNEFRASFFKDPNQFYNAAHAILALSDFSHFVDSLPTPPQVIIVAMSPSYF